jgi:TMEM175 potassium channel family protein
MMHFVTAVDRTLLWINLLLLLFIVFIPYVAVLLSASHADSSAIRIYGSTLILINLAGTALWSYATRYHRLVNPTMPPSFVRFILCVHTAPILVYSLAIALASWHSVISLILFAVVPAFFILPNPWLQRRIRQASETIGHQERGRQE